MPPNKRGALEIHFAVSDEIGVYRGKDAVSHIGFSVGDVGYNCGRNEGRDEVSILSNGPYVAVRSPYRMDGFYLKLTDTKEIASAFQEFVDGYLEGRLDRNGIEIDAVNTSDEISGNRLDSMWFVKTVQGLKDIEAIKRLGRLSFKTYDQRLRHQYPLLNNIEFEELETFRYADTPKEELEVLAEAYPFLSKMTVAQYRRIRRMNRREREELVSLLVDLKRDLRNRMYDTRVLSTRDFGNGKYQMVKGYNCVRATFFFLNRGLTYAKNRLRGQPELVREIVEIESLVGRLQKGNQKLRIPWRSFRRARWYSDEYMSMGFLDTPEDGVFWMDTKQAKAEARLADRKKKPLSLGERKRLIAKLTKKTDVIEYEQEGIEYVSPAKLTDAVKQRCQPFDDLLSGFGLGAGGGKRTRFV